MRKFGKTSKLLISLLAVVLIMSCFAGTAFASYSDSTYYNTGCLTAYETNTLVALSLLKGDVVVMTPDDNDFYVGEEAEQMIIDGDVNIISIVGVGSSVIGTAAFAKHIAIIKDEPVAGIVVGYGDGTIYTEGTQGYYIGRSSNIAGVYYTEPASQKLVDLYEAGARPTLLVGHSKGNMDLANALFKMYNEGHQSWYSGVAVKTFGCGVYVPSGVGSFNQYIGTYDSLGYYNTVNWSNMTYVFGRYHTTNPFYAYTYMPIQNYL
mgnify:CR=1 FL=1